MNLDGLELVGAIGFLIIAVLIAIYFDLKTSPINPPPRWMQKRQNKRANKAAATGEVVMDASDMFYDKRNDPHVTARGTTNWPPQVGSEITIRTPIANGVGTVIDVQPVDAGEGEYEITVDLETPAAAVERLIRSLDR